MTGANSKLRVHRYNRSSGAPRPGFARSEFQGRGPEGILGRGVRAARSLQVACRSRASRIARSLRLIESLWRYDMAVTLHGRIYYVGSRLKMEFLAKGDRLRKIALLTIFVSYLRLRKQDAEATFEPVQSGQRISISKPVIIIEKPWSSRNHCLECNFFQATNVERTQLS